MNKPILEIKIDVKEGGTRINTKRGEVSIVPFGGTVKSELFNGIVEPWGIDRQVLDHSGLRHLSARYMLTGKDKEGNDCHIYIENNGHIENVPSLTFKSVPTFYTDSPVLADYLHYDRFYGTGTVDENHQLWIRFYEVEE